MVQRSRAKHAAVEAVIRIPAGELLAAHGLLELVENGFGGQWVALIHITGHRRLPSPVQLRVDLIPV